jgi:hypothetical protein
MEKEKISLKRSYDNEIMENNLQRRQIEDLQIDLRKSLKENSELIKDNEVF